MTTVRAQPGSDGIGRVAITGGYGFLGWHTACRLRAVHQTSPLLLGRAQFLDPDVLVAVLGSVDVVLHLAGVSRGSDPRQVEHGNIELAGQLAAAIEAAARPVDVVYANSIQADLDNPYGRGKAAAADRLDQAVTTVGGRFADVLLPNLFGEHGRPHYNSFVATFASEVAAGRTPSVADDRSIGLLHAQDAAALLIDQIQQHGRHRIGGEAHRISEVLDQLVAIHDVYGGRGEIPDLSSRFAVQVFNTYRAAAFPHGWPKRPIVHRDERGELFESVRVHGGTGQGFVSSTRPGHQRGNHYHLEKIERFTVVRGEAEIRLRRLLHEEVISFRLSGTEPAFVDMPTLWVHSIRNVGSSDLITTFWADQLLDPVAPDQYAELVDPR